MLISRFFGKVIQVLKTNHFGDFKFDGLEPESGEYTISVNHKNLSFSNDFSFNESINLGLIALK